MLCEALHCLRENLSILEEVVIPRLKHHGQIVSLAAEALTVVGLFVSKKGRSHHINTEPIF